MPWCIVLTNEDRHVEGVIGPFPTEDAADYYSASHEETLHPWRQEFVEMDAAESAVMPEEA